MRQLSETVLLASLILTGCGQPNKRPVSDEKYEFHTGVNGSVIWRCNRVTGEVEFCRVQQPYWHKVLEKEDPLGIERKRVLEPNGITNAFQDLTPKHP